MQMSCERVCVTVSVYVVVVWQGPMEEQFLYWMDFTLYKYIWKNKKIKNKTLPEPLLTQFSVAIWCH